MQLSQVVDVVPSRLMGGGAERMESEREGGGTVWRGHWPVLALLGLLGFGPGAATPAAPAAPDAVRERLAVFERSAPLHHALHRRQYDRALALMVAEADIDRQEPTYGLTALGLACQDPTADAIDMVQPLLATYGADPDAVDQHGFRALHYAAQAGNYAVVAALLRFGAEIDAANPQAEGAPVTPLYLAYRRGRNRIAQLLRRHGAREPEPEVLRELELAAALFRAAQGSGGLAGGAVQAVTQARLEAMSRATEQTLREQGRLAELEGWQQIKRRVSRVLLSTPVQVGEPAAEYIRRVSGSLQGAR